MEIDGKELFPLAFIVDLVAQIRALLSEHNSTLVFVMFPVSHSAKGSCAIQYLPDSSLSVRPITQLPVAIDSATPCLTDLDIKDGRVVYAHCASPPHPSQFRLA